MSTLIQLQQLSHSLGSKPLFEGLDLTINSGDSIGLVGYNGTGKSSLLSLVEGGQQQDEGEIIYSNALNLETVEQFIEEKLLHLSLFDAVLEKLTIATDASGEYKVDIILQQLGFAESEYDYAVKDLSGGQQNRLMFARAVIGEPNFILFDEPTNHLDVRTIVYFERFLNEMNAGFLLVSHDRDFLDSVTNRTLFLRDGKLLSFNLPYSQAANKLREADIAAEARRKEEEKSIDRLKASAKRLALWGKVYDNEKLARKAKTMEKRVEKLEASKTFVTRGSDLKLDLSVGSSRANRMLQIEDKTIYAPGSDAKALFQIENLTIKPGDRLALLGENGSGKTSLIALIMNQYHKDSESAKEELVKFNPGCRIGYYDQELVTLEPALSILEALRKDCDSKENELVSSLIRAGFAYKDHSKKTGVLSGGEKARLIFLMMQLNQPNFLILDEPTNHIDIPGKEDLEQQLLASSATLLITSHDRRFINNIATRFVLIENRKLTEINHPDEFWNNKKIKSSTSVAKISAGAVDAARGKQIQIQTQKKNPEQILERIIELESKLEADSQRKGKHQKPKLQQSWKREIERLNQLLEDL